MKKRVLILVGSLGVLALVWTLTWDKYQESLLIEEGASESEKKSSSRPPVFKRLPAQKPLPILEKPKAMKTSFFLERVVDRKPTNFRPSKHKIIESGNQKFNIVEDLIAVKASHRNRYSSDEIVEEKFSFLLVKKNGSEDSENLVVQNSRTKRLAILTGVFKIKLFNHEDWSKISEKYSLIEQANFPGIRLTLLKTNDLNKLESILSQLNKDSMVERAELEILENPPVTN